MTPDRLTLTDNVLMKTEVVQAPLNIHENLLSDGVLVTFPGAWEHLKVVTSEGVYRHLNTQRNL